MVNLAKDSTLKVVTEDGEVIDFNIVVNIQDIEGLRLSADVPPNGVISSKNIRLYKPKTEQLVNNNYHEHYGEMMNITTSRHYAKNYTAERNKISFKKDSSYRFWYEVTTSLEYNSNVIIFRDPIRPVRTVTELQELLQCGKNTAYQFFNECNNKGYIVKVKYIDSDLLVVNPKYVNMGTKMPVLLLGLFEFGEQLLAKKEATVSKKENDE